MLNDEQQAALAIIVAHCEDRSPSAPEERFLVFEGPAGVGKTFVISKLPNEVKKKIVFTAPTNKAVRVLKEMLTTADYKPECRTIHSLLGLSMQANGEIKELSESEDKVNLSDYGVVVIDEGSMLNEKMRGFLLKAAEAHPNIRWIIMGDRWQLPPVGEDLSTVWAFQKRVELTKIMRQDNTILALSSHVRDHITLPFAALKLVRTPDVFPLTTSDFKISVVENAQSFLEGESKLIAWRNLTVNNFNRLIRSELFAESERYPWQQGDRITLTGPANDLLRVNENGKHPKLASTDDEGVIERAEIASHPKQQDFTCWRLQVRFDDNRMGVLWALRSSEEGKFTGSLSRLAAEARDYPKLWYKYWEFKEAFHPVRHAYAITAHRAQGSTYDRAYVNWRDVLLNPNKPEAFRCLYVAVTRPKKELILG